MMLGIIPARKGSKGIIDKNIKNICGKRLIDWTIDSAKKILPLVVTTDYIYSFNAEKILRPPELCGDDEPTITAIQHAIKQYEKTHMAKVTSICLLQPTSPLRTSDDIEKCLYIYREYNQPVYSGYSMFLKEEGKVFNKKQDPKYHFQRNGAIFIATREMIDAGIIFDDTCIKYEMPLSRSIDIDTEDDWFIAESLLKNKGEC